MSKGERISQRVGQLVGPAAVGTCADIRADPFYRAFFHCWNQTHYYEAHEVLEQLWLKTQGAERDFLKGLIQAAGAFVHLQKNFAHPTHPKHGRRLAPAARLFRSAEENLSAFAPRHQGLDVDAFCRLLRFYAGKIVSSHYETNPWSPDTAPKLTLG